MNKEKEIKQTQKDGKEQKKRPFYRHAKKAAPKPTASDLKTPKKTENANNPAAAVPGKSGQSAAPNKDHPRTRKPSKTKVTSDRNKKNAEGGLRVPEEPKKQETGRYHNAARPQNGQPSPQKYDRKPDAKPAGTTASAVSRTGGNKSKKLLAANTPAQKNVKMRHPGTQFPKVVSGAKIRVISLGGLQEIGKNMTVIECGDDIVVIDCGMAFPDEEMPGIDYVIPDISYLVKNADKVRGILITHGHEDHIGAVGYVLSQIRVPVYGTRLSLGIIAARLEESPLPFTPELCTVEAGDVVTLGGMSAEFIHVNHSIADACAIAVRTAGGLVFHTGDFKLDVSPIDGKIMDLQRISEIGKEGVTLLLCESTNAERPGFTPSEKTVGSSLERIFLQYVDRRIIIATFSSNVHRVQQIINASRKHGRKVAILGRSMTNVVGAASELGYMDLSDDVLIDVDAIKRYKPEQITLITTGSQGEPMSALYRIAFDEHEKIKLTSRDVVILSSSAIPGNERTVGNIINALVKNGVKVVNDTVEEVHVSGHACREELKLMMALTKPKFLMPIHGEYRHLYANKEIGEFMGIPAQNIFVAELGKVLEVSGSGAKFLGAPVTSGKVLVDGSGVGDVGNIVLRDRKHLSEDGLVVVVATVDLLSGLLVSGPDIVSRGFVYVKEAENLMDGVKRVATAALEKSLGSNHADFNQIKTDLRDAIAKYLYKATKRKPMVLPVLMDI